MENLKMSQKDKDAPQGFWGKIQDLVWPIHGNEIKKFLPMAIMMGLVLFNYTLLRITKDTLVIADKASGTEVTSFLKVWGVVPAAFIFFLIYAKLSNVLSKENLFYATISPFLVFFGVFSVLIYPNQELLHFAPEKLAALKEAYPNFKFIFPMIGHWTNSLFYIMSELWGTVILSLLFWQFANDITRTNEAKRFYAHFGLLGNFFVIFAGYLAKEFATVGEKIIDVQDAYGHTLHYVMISVVIAGFCIIFIYNWMNRTVLKDPALYEGASASPKKKSKAKMSIKDSFSYLLHSRYLGLIALLVLTYGISMNLIEQTWKNELRTLYPTKAAYSAAMGGVLQWTGFATVIVMLLGSNILRVLGWFTAALLTPIMMLITGALFFSFVLFRETLSPYLSIFMLTPLVLAVWIGAVQNILAKATKYALFDPTKEMAYIPLDQELKVKGKAAVDVVGGRLGKSGGAITQQVLLIVTAGTQLTIAPYLAGVTMIALIVWVFAVVGLNKKYQEAIQKDNN
jgi:ATP:ADP antiporter, AAA family